MTKLNHWSWSIIPKLHQTKDWGITYARRIDREVANTEDLRIEREIHKSTKLVPTHTLTDQLVMKICRGIFPIQTKKRSVHYVSCTIYLYIYNTHIVCTKCIYILNTQTANNVMVKKAICFQRRSIRRGDSRFMSSHLCFNERFSLELHVNPLTHNRVCCCQMRLENGIFILLEQASKSWTDDGPIGM